MAMCKFCHKPMAWGLNTDGKYVPLVPIGEDEGLARTFQDENGALRAEHRDVCDAQRGGPTVRVARLAVAIQSEDIIGAKPKRGRPRKKLDLPEISPDEPCAVPF